jgi:hypothetical protein
MEGVALIYGNSAGSTGVDLKGHRLVPGNQKSGLFSRQLRFDFLSESAVFKGLGGKGQLQHAPCPSCPGLRLIRIQDIRTCFRRHLVLEDVMPHFTMITKGKRYRVALKGKSLWKTPIDA